MITSPNRWELVKVNPTYLAGALSEAEAQAIRWHSPSSARSSQVFCISAFGSLRQLPDGQEILQALLARHFPGVSLTGPWKLTLEYTDRQVLDESGGVTPTSVDVFCQSASSVVCIESKFIADALEGFGSCGQFPEQCHGFYGPGSDKKTNTSANCRLGIAPRAVVVLARTGGEDEHSSRTTSSSSSVWGMHAHSEGQASN